MPGFVLTLPIAAGPLFLASAESSFVTGHVLNVDGGFHAAGLLFEDDTTVPAHADLPSGNGEGAGKGAVT